jgi:rod shape-determining protein MreD
MKKTLSIIIVFITFIFIYFLQSNFFNWFNIAGIKPNLFIILSLFIGIFIGKVYGGVIGILMGVLLDFFIGKTVGINAISLGLAGLLGGLFTKNFSKDSRLTIMLMSCAATLACELISYIYQIILFKLSIEIWLFIKLIGIEILFNAMIIIIIYPLIDKTGILLERIFTQDKILTRYY